MSTFHDDKVDSVVAFVSGALIGVAVTLLFIRMNRNRYKYTKLDYEDYNYEGGDLFV